MAVAKKKTTRKRAKRKKTKEEYQDEELYWNDVYSRVFSSDEGQECLLHIMQEAGVIKWDGKAAEDHLQVRFGSQRLGWRIFNLAQMNPRLLAQQMKTKLNQPKYEQNIA